MFSHTDHNQPLRTWSWFHKMFHLLHTKDLTSLSSGADLYWSIILQYFNICLNTSVELFLFYTTSDYTRTAVQVSMWRPLLKTQKVLFVQTEKTVLPTVKIRKIITKFFEYPISITISKKRHNLKNDHYHRRK